MGLLATAVLADVVFTVTGCNGPKETTPTKDSGLVLAGLPNKYAVPPVDIGVSFEKQNQELVNDFSWRSFIAFCWPANTGNCTADTSIGSNIFNGNGPVVWESYLSTDQVFVSSGSPSNWCTPTFDMLPKKVQELSQRTGIRRFIHRLSKTPAGPHALGQASGQPLVDQNGRFVRYEVRMNQDEYNYILAKNLWNAAGQNKFTSDSTITMPSGQTQYGNLGSIEFKAAWKIMGPGDDTTRFYKIKAIVYNDNAGDPSPGPNPVTLGLVGLHIAHKTPTQRNWVWSTFEQVDNLTSSFFNNACDTCPINTPPQTDKAGHYVELNPDGTPIHKPTQVKRINPTADATVAGVNSKYQGMLKGSVWANYQLISTQWLQFEDITPMYLANSVQETYLQGPSPASYGTYTLSIDQPYYASPKYQPFSAASSSSCMGCHYTATGVGTAKTDFSFILGEAH